MSNINLNESKNRYDSVEAPLDLNINIEAGMKSGKRYRRIKKRVPLYGIAAIFLAFAITINTSVAFAEAVKAIPILQDMAEILMVNEGIKYALKEGYIQDINKSVEIDGVKVTITRIIGDYTELIIGYKIEGENIDKNNFYGFDTFNISTADEEGIGGFISYEHGDYADDGLKPIKGERYISMGNIQVEELPKELILVFKDVVNMEAGYESSKYTVARKEISIPIELNDKIINVQPEIYTLNKKLELGDKTLSIKEMRVYPMSTEVIINNVLNEDEIFGWLDNSYLEDERGRAFGLSSGTGPFEDGEYTLTFNGGAYGKSKELTLYSNGMFYNPKEGRQLVVDLKNKTLVDGSQHGLELTGIRNYGEYKVDDEDMGTGVTTEQWDIDEEEPKTENTKENLVYKGVEISFKSIKGYGISNVSISHPDCSRSGMSNTGEGGEEIEAYVYFDEVEMLDDILYLDLDSLHSNRNKTESFSVKLK